MLRPEERHIFRTESPTNLVQRWRKKTRIADKRHDLQGQRSRWQDHVVRVTGVGPLLKNKKSQKHQQEFQGQLSKVTGRPINFKFGTDGARRSVSPTRAVISKVKGQGRKVTWSV